MSSRSVDPRQALPVRVAAERDTRKRIDARHGLVILAQPTRKLETYQTSHAMTEEGKRLIEVMHNLMRHRFHYFRQPFQR